MLLVRAPRALPPRPAAAVRILALVLLCAGAALFQSLELVRHPLRFWLLHDAPWTAYLGRTDLRGTWLAGHEATGRYLREHAAPGDRLVVSEAGVVPFYADLHTVDLFGLTHRRLASLWSGARAADDAGVRDLALGMVRESFEGDPRWIVLDGHRGPEGGFQPRLQVGRWLLGHPEARRYRPVFRAVVYRAGTAGLPQDRVNVVFERRDEGSSAPSDAEGGAPAPG